MTIEIRAILMQSVLQSAGRLLNIFCAKHFAAMDSPQIAGTGQVRGKSKIEFPIA